MATQIFMRVPDEVLMQIFKLIQEAHPPTLYSLLFIRSIQPIAEALIYRNITIQSPTRWSSKHWPVHENLIKRIINPQNRLNSNIRELCIVDWPGFQSFDFGVRILEKLIESIEFMVKFKWHSWHYIPPTVLRLFHSRFPTAQLSVNNRERGKSVHSSDPNDMAMDLNTLKSPQLHSLDTVVLAESRNNHIRTISEFSVLKRVLQHSPNLRSLRIGIRTEYAFHFHEHQEQYAEYDTNDNGPLYFDFNGGDTFPALQELAFQNKWNDFDPKYELTMAHCLGWKQAMNCKVLTKLDLGKSQPNNFFAVFRGYVPQLKSLRFCLTLFDTWDADHNTQSPLLMQSTLQFLESITALEELAVEDWTRVYFRELCPGILKFSHSLRSLEIVPLQGEDNSMEYPPLWSAPELTEVLECLDKLTYLTISLEFEDNLHYAFHSTLERPDHPFVLLSRFSRLEKLKLRMRLPPGPHADTRIDKTGVSRMAEELFASFFKHDLSSRLEIVQSEMQRTTRSFYGSDAKGVTAKVRKSVRDDAPSPLDGGYSVVITDECESFRE